jgi:hypothetical protein
MTLRLQGDVRGRKLTRPCPVCGGDMEKQEKCTDGVLWQCQNDDCAHQEEP